MSYMCEIGQSTDRLWSVYGRHSLALRGSAFASCHMEFHKGRSQTVPTLFCMCESGLELHLGT